MTAIGSPLKGVNRKGVNKFHDCLLFLGNSLDVTFGCEERGARSKESNNEWKLSPLAFRSRVNVASGGGDGGGVVASGFSYLAARISHRASRISHDDGDGDDDV